MEVRIDPLLSLTSGCEKTHVLLDYGLRGVPHSALLNPAICQLSAEYFSIAKRCAPLHSSSRRLVLHVQS
jgi:hypothetical protein